MLMGVTQIWRMGGSLDEGEIPPYWAALPIKEASAYCRSFFVVLHIWKRGGKPIILSFCKVLESFIKHFIYFFEDGQTPLQTDQQTDRPRYQSSKLELENEVEKFIVKYRVHLYNMSVVKNKVYTLKLWPLTFQK